MADPIAQHIAENYQTYGIIFFTGGLVATVGINVKNIRSLWKVKQDRTVCDPLHEALKDDIADIKIDVRWLRDRKENDGP